MVKDKDRLSEQEIVKIGQEVLSIESEAVAALIDTLDQGFARAVSILAQAEGRVILTGMGKHGIIARKISATFASMGTASLFLHPAEAIHGDLGMVLKDDIVITLSNSGQTEEITKLIPLIKRMEAFLIAIVGERDSYVADSADIVLFAGVEKEACHLGLAPTASSTAALAIGDALAVSVSRLKGLQPEDFAFYHPGGVLGKKLLLCVKDIMRTGEHNPVVQSSESIKDALLMITKAHAGAVCVIGEDGALQGFFTDGDLRRCIEDKDADFLFLPISEVMTHDPYKVKADDLAWDALTVLREHEIDEVPVIDQDGGVVGLLDIQDLIRVGLV